MTKKTNRNINFKLLMPIILSIVLAVGIFIGKSLNRLPSNLQTIFPAPNKLDWVMGTIINEYVDTVDEAMLSEQAIQTIISKLDPHTRYISAEKLQAMNEALEGKFYGIGIQFNIFKDTISVVQIIKGGPSEKAGILAGDRIITVNDSLVAGKGITSAGIIKYLKGEKGSPVNVGIKRKGSTELLQFEIIRDEISVSSINVYYLITNDIGYVKIDKFNSTTHADLVAALENLKAQGMQNLILDLRYNGGGYLNTAVKIASEFLPENKLIVYTQGKNSPRKDYFATANGLFESGKLAILIDSWSASASEVVAGAIQDNDRGAIIGRRSFGKGLVQISKMFHDGSALDITIARYYSPSGRCIQKPYNEGVAKYDTEVFERYKNGEFITADSIHFDTTKQFKTVGGKTVYGGGGITPNIFVPIDTTVYSALLNKIVGDINEYAFEYVDNNRPILSKFQTASELCQYLDNKYVINNFTKKIRLKNTQIKVSEINRNKKIIKNYLYAFICRNALGEKAYFQIMENLDKTLQKAIDYLEN